MTDPENEKEKKLQILDYWYINEFLNQDSLIKPRRPKLSEQAQRVIKKIHLSFYLAQNDDNLFQKVFDVASPYKMNIWGPITVYIGSIARENCIKEIGAALNVTDARPEKNYDHIAIAAMQLSTDFDSKSFTYIDYSFSLSPVVWSAQSSKSVENITKQFSIEKFTEAENSIGKELEAVDFTTKSLYELNKTICDKYSFLNTENDSDNQQQILCEFTAYRDETVMSVSESDEYTGLHNTFYISEIKMIRDAIESGDLREGGMNSAICKYITEPYYNYNHQPTVIRENIANIKPQDKESYGRFLFGALDITCAPLGKWPSRYSPALMQQIAINAVTSENRNAFPKLQLPVFSVNGPPGTGKTTMIQEIIADNIVKRAILLSEYDDPDDDSAGAFDEHYFNDGENGNRYYCKFYPKYYSLRDDKINDYSILVTSSNNVPVENITKELPLVNKLASNLQTSTKDGAEKAGAINNVLSLFDLSDDIHDKDNDMYFSEEAKKVLEKDQLIPSNENTWGLISVPLGKQSRTSNFARIVIFDVLHKWMKSYKNQELNYKQKYIQKKDDFLKQKAIVEKKQAELEEICCLYQNLSLMNERINSGSKKLSETKLDYEDHLLKYKNKMNEETQLKQKLVQDAQILDEKYNAANAAEQQHNEKTNLIKNKYEQSRRSADAAIKNAGFIARIFNTAKKKSAEEDAQKWNKLADVYEEQLEAELPVTERLHAELENLLDRKQLLQDQIDNAQNNCCTYQEKIQKLSEEREKEVASLNQEKYNYQQLQEKLKSITQNYSSEMKRFVPITDSFIQQLVDGDDLEQTKAQIEDPWFTFEYDIERIKLFYCALQLNKYFVLASKHCNANLQHLYAYWTGAYSFKDSDHVIFSERDKKDMIPSLYETLFLLVPVVSSTFASVGRFLKDLSRPRTIGLLVIDEAGQAQPQMALGALYRSRKAIIVGDPRQIEPVVKDELRMLDTVFTNDIYAAYKEHDISVQKCADLLNPYGTYLGNDTPYPEWVGSPLLVHRRCISPMFEISNEISYGGIMKQQTRQPSAEKEKTFIGSSSWINVTGLQNGKSDHYNELQGRKAAELVFLAFEKALDCGMKEPSLYIISPFKTVVYTIKKKLSQEYYNHYKKNKTQSTNIPTQSAIESWAQNNIGTVHTFQGKEADQVIFLLGCDASQNAKNAIQWVNSHIVNVAVTRAKYRLFIIGDGEAWENNKYIKHAKTVLDTYKLKEIDSQHFVYPTSKKDLSELNSQLPGFQSFAVEFQKNDENGEEYTINTNSFLAELTARQVCDTSLTDEQVKQFGFRTKDDLNFYPRDIKQNLFYGIKLFYLLKPIYDSNKDVDASVCAILFCKALELHVKECLLPGLQKALPDFPVSGSGNKRKNIPLSDLKKEEATLGTIDYVIKNNLSRLAGCINYKGEKTYTKEWWENYEKKLRVAIQRRNNCCHAQKFKYSEFNKLLADMFKSNYPDPRNQDPSPGLMESSKVGRKLKKSH